jgi:hypothetical protein
MWIEAFEICWSFYRTFHHNPSWSSNWLQFVFTKLQVLVPLELPGNLKTLPQCAFPAPMNQISLIEFPAQIIYLDFSPNFLPWIEHRLSIEQIKLLTPNKKPQVWGENQLNFSLASMEFSFSSEKDFRFFFSLVWGKETFKHLV